MARTTLDTIEELLEGAVEETDDPEVHYKLNSARQLVAVVKRHHQELDETLADAVDDEETLDDLRDLGYLD